MVGVRNLSKSLPKLCRAKKHLKICTVQGHAEMVGLLLAAGADVNKQDSLGATPLHRYGTVHIDEGRGQHAVLQIRDMLVRIWTPIKNYLFLISFLLITF
jgi:hypothetical protein